MAFGLGILGTFLNPDTPEFDKIEIVKNQAIKDRIDTGLKGVESTQGQAETDIGRILDRFKQQTPGFEAATDQGVSLIDRLFSDQYRSDLAGLRANESAATRAATDKALRQVEAADKAQRARLGVRGGNSYLDINRSRTMADTEIGNALRNAQQERADYNQILQTRLGNLGTRQNLLQSLMSRESQPTELSARLRSLPLQDLAALQQMEAANTYRGLNQKKTTWDKIGEASDIALSDLNDLISTAGNAVGVVGGVMSGGILGGGGGNSQPLAASQRLTTSQGGGYGGYGGEGLNFNTGQFRLNPYQKAGFY